MLDRIPPEPETGQAYINNLVYASSRLAGTTTYKELTADLRYLILALERLNKSTTIPKEYHYTFASSQAMKAAYLKMDDILKGTAAALLVINRTYPHYNKDLADNISAMAADIRKSRCFHPMSHLDPASSLASSSATTGRLLMAKL